MSRKKSSDRDPAPIAGEVAAQAPVKNVEKREDQLRQILGRAADRRTVRPSGYYPGADEYHPSYGIAGHSK